MDENLQELSTGSTELLGTAVYCKLSLAATRNFESSLQSPSFRGSRLRSVQQPPTAASTTIWHKVCTTEVFTGAFWFTLTQRDPSPDWATSCCGWCTHVTTESNGGGYVLHFSLPKCGDAQTGIETRLSIALPVPLRGRFEFLGREGTYVAWPPRNICTAFQYQSPSMRGVQTTRCCRAPPERAARALRGRKSSSNGGEERMKR